MENVFLKLPSLLSAVTGFKSLLKALAFHGFSLNVSLTLLFSFFVSAYFSRRCTFLFVYF